jgi:hypothetical protein
VTNSAVEAKRRSNRPLSIRFSDSEKALLAEKAGGLPLGTFIRAAVLGEGVKPRLTRQRHPVRNGEQLGSLLGLLGQSRMANNLNQLAKAANSGSLPVTVETEAELKQACAYVAEMRQLLLLALGIEASGDPRPHLSAEFSKYAGDPA